MVRFSMFNTLACLFLLSCAKHDSGQSQSSQDSTRISKSQSTQPKIKLSTEAILNSNIELSEGARIGIFRMPDDSKAKLKPLHSRLISGLRANDQVAFRAALLQFWEVPVAIITTRAAFAKGASYGSGGGGSSDTFAKGFGDGINVGLAGIERAKVQNAVICTYFYGSDFGDCGGEKLFEFYGKLKSGTATISDFENLINSGRS